MLCLPSQRVTRLFFLIAPAALGKTLGFGSALLGWQHVSASCNYLELQLISVQSALLSLSQLSFGD